MIGKPLNPLLRHVRTLVGPGAAPPDAELLRRYLARRDEEAFAALVRRHGPLVLGVCRRLLPSSHDVEDVFQATFLALARQARSLRHQRALAGWLHSVARRLEALEEAIRPLALTLTPDREPATLFRADLENE